MGKSRILGERPAQFYAVSTTLGRRAFTQSWLHVATVGGITLTLPTPDRDLTGFPAFFLNTGDTAVTISGTMGPGAAVSFSLGNGQGIELVAVEYSPGLFAYGGLGAGPTEAITPTLAWTTADPTITTQVHRIFQNGNRLTGTSYIACSDGLNASGLTIQFPTGYVPANVGQIVPCRAITSVNAAAAINCVAYLDATQAVAASRLLTCLIPIFTSGQTAWMSVSYDFEAA